MLDDEDKKTTSGPRYTHIYCLLSALVHPSVCLCFVLYNVRAYAYVRLNVYKYKIMLINVNSFGYVKIVSYLCNVIKKQTLLIFNLYDYDKASKNKQEREQRQHYAKY